MTTRLAPLLAPERLRPAAMTTRLAPLPAPEGLRPALSGAAGRSPARAAPKPGN